MVHICDLHFLLYHADMTIYQKMHWPECGNTDILKAGFTAKRKQGYHCRFTACDKSHFFLVQLGSNTRTFFKPVKLDLYKSIYMVSPYSD